MLRLGMAVTVVVVTVAMGVMHRSPLIIALATPVFVLLYALGKWEAWRLAWRLGGARRIAQATAITLPIQAALVGVLYLSGLGLGRLTRASAEIVPLSVVDLSTIAGLAVVGVAITAVIIRMEARRPGESSPLAPLNLDTGAPIVLEIPELDIDPTPVTPETFFTAPGYWRPDVAMLALEQQGEIIEKPPLAADDTMIARAETRLGVRLPEGLRALYRRMNGGHVGPMYVAWKADPQPVFDDWRGAFSIDYSSLRALDSLCFVTEHYDAFTHDPEDLPEHADRRLILEARYGDMTLLDYSVGPEPRVLLVDYDRYGSDDPIDVAFETFDDFCAALRRERDEDRSGARMILTTPSDPDEKAARFWSGQQPHPFHQNRTFKPDLTPGQTRADDVLIEATEARLGVRLPRRLADLYRLRNGGEVLSRKVRNPDREVMTRLLPLEYIVSLGALSDRIAFASDEIAWGARVDHADRLIVLEAELGRTVLLDYRMGPDMEPRVLSMGGLDRETIENAEAFETFDDLYGRLGFLTREWEWMNRDKTVAS